ncbi:hypothetical protein BD779DRAFT_1536863 [Infundibulicybe gibba]|nr:hypothetical protein BD779DRAFT_1536863 [Infundibulicybe gibba]
MSETIEQELVSSESTIAEDTQAVLDATPHDVAELIGNLDIHVAGGNGAAALLAVPSGAYPFQANADFLDISRFLNHLYLADLWIERELMATTYRELIRPIGRARLTPDGAEPVGDTLNPGWMPQEAWRALNAFQGVLSKSSFGQLAHTPVRDFLAVQGAAAGSLSNALFPVTIRNLLRANEDQIAARRTNWVGRGATATPIATPFQNIQVAWAGPNIGYYQRGAAGPFSIEAALILATQLAGINLNSIDRTELPRNVPWYWLGAMTAATGQQNTGTHLFLRPNPPPARDLFGYNYKPTSLRPAGDPGAGFYLAFEVDFDLRARGDRNRNVFVFAFHAIDEHSRVQVTNRASLRQLNYTAYAPPTSANGPLPGNPGQPPAGNANGANARFYGHAHAGYVRYSDLEDFLYQGQNGQVPQREFPTYSQIGFLHMYILSENENETAPMTFWPRGVYRAARPIPN